ncbi:hypothetical protein BUALT_Bualt03G0001300 [Buddleja alternifolia]|uniref:Uncharacterized protein n=1 Tax=Buddleja alternifolia TaxID=168488 RepID=A0AAV6XWS0_9LAMI|nr:hypothetical protein BUALT_Bualt03G0001300 [Buddleja alternifolia]
MTPPPSEFFSEKYSSSSEKHISVDPISLGQETSPPPVPDTQYSVMSLPPLQNNPKTNKLMIFSCSSLPNCATSSPTKHKKKLLSKSIKEDGLSRQHSVALSNLERLRESQLRRSKSCGERRACQPSLDFDLWSTTSTTKNKMEEDKKGGWGDDQGGRQSISYDDEKFKCGALCLFLPGFGKTPKAAVRPRSKEEEESVEPDIVSQRVSLEKFECGSWRSSAIINCEDQDGDATSSLFFDLPVELIRCSNVNDTESPVTTAFLFDNKDQDQHRHPKGVLKNTTTITTTQPRKSYESSSTSSSRHVRFSTSSPTSPTSSCITPRLRKARDDFNAFLEAQSA